MATLLLDVTLTSGRVDIDRAKLDSYFRDPQGDLTKDVERRTFNLKIEVGRQMPMFTGTLRGTLRSKVATTTGVPVGTVTVGDPGFTDYLGYILYGTRPHRILPKQDRPNPHLRWYTPRPQLGGSGGTPVFSKGVMHPGTRPDDFLNRALPAALR